MRYVPRAQSISPDAAFKYVGGDPSLDLVNTVEWGESGMLLERLTGYERLTRWAEGAAVVDPEVGERLRRAAEMRPLEAEAAYEEALALRWVLKRLFTSAATGSSRSSALDDFNDFLSEALRHLRLSQSGAEIGWSWRGEGDDLSSMLWPVAWAAARLLASEERGRIRACGAPDCGWMYVDRSRNHLRRWCQMETCGTRAKTRRRSARQRG